MLDGEVAKVAVVLCIHNFSDFVCNCYSPHVCDTMRMQLEAQSECCTCQEDYTVYITCYYGSLSTHVLVGIAVA